MARSAFSPFIFQLPATSGLMLRVTSFLRKLCCPGSINARLAPQSHVNRKHEAAAAIAAFAAGSYKQRRQKRARARLRATNGFRERQLP
jgi:hypothetical protein